MLIYNPQIVTITRAQTVDNVGCVWYNSGMYIRKTTRKGKNKTYTNYLLVKSVMTPKGPRQKTICSLGNLEPRPGHEWLALAHKVEQTLLGQLDLNIEEQDPLVQEIVGKVKNAHRQEVRKDQKDEEVVSICPEKVEVEKPREAGPVHVGCSFWEKLELDSILEEVGLSPRSQLLTKIMVMNRLIFPSSEHAMPDWVNRTALSDLMGLDLTDLKDDSLYRNIDRLINHKDEIEKKLTTKERDLFNLDQSIFLYDLTSTYFEGNCQKNPQAKRGYSRDKRPDCKQVVIGLVVNRDGFPITHEVFEGSRADTKTVDAILNSLEAKLGSLEKGMIVVDRGMASKENLAQIKAKKCQYIVATRQAERNDWLDEFEGDGWEEVIRKPSPTNPSQKKPRVLVKRASLKDEQYILCVSEGRAEKDKAIRQSHENKLLEALEKLQNRVEKGRLKSPEKIYEAIGRIKERYPRVARYYSIEYADRLTWKEDVKKKGVAENLDGGYILRTSCQDLQTDEVWQIYSLLTRAESAFRAMKSPLSEQPIFHQLEHRVQGHIFLCILAYHLLIAIEKTLKDKGVCSSWETVREVLTTHQIVTVVLPTSNGKTLRIRRCTKPEPSHLDIYNALGLPTRVIKPVKTWSLDSDSI